MNDKMTTPQLMRHVIYAMSIGIVAQFYFYGWSGMVQIVLAVGSALLFEWLLLMIRKKPIGQIKQTLSDGSMMVSALLLAVSIPTIAPWWLIILGVFFAVVFGKHLYGGLGHNPFNPAMLGYAFLLISYPLAMTQWQDVFFMSFEQAIGVIFQTTNIDAITRPTPLESKQNDMATPIINLAFLLGGVYMLLKQIIRWQIPLSLLVAIVLFASVFQLLGEDYSSAGFHLITGSTMLAAFFIATDPVSASTTPLGRLVYGFLIGFIIIIIRSFGGYPDGVAFAVLLANIAVPLIDYYTQPKIFGAKK